MKLVLSKKRIENMMNHLYANNVEATWWIVDTELPVEIHHEVYVKINKNIQNQFNFFEWIRTWFPKTNLVEDTDEYIKFKLEV